MSFYQSNDFLKPIDGFLLLNKPYGMTSQQSVSYAKRLFDSKKAGHTGSLDPMATGLLPICFGEATKFCQFLLMTDKHYRFTMKLGIKTDTGDAQGNVIATAPVLPVAKSRLLEILNTFKGKINQIPPLFSAIKHQGQPLYRFARRGIHIERKARVIKIDELKLVSSTQDQLILEVSCSKGTYIRSLVEDIGEMIGCGAHVSALHRLSVGKYHIENSICFEQIESFNSVEKRRQQLLPLDNILPSHWPEMKLSKAAIFYLHRGQPLTLPNMPPNGWVRLRSKENNTVLGLGQILKDGRLAPYRLLNLT